MTTMLMKTRSKRCASLRSTTPSMINFAVRADMNDTGDNNIQRRIGGLEALVSSNRDGIQEMRQSIKELQASSIETQKLVISNGESVWHAVSKLEHMKTYLDRLRSETERNDAAIEERVGNLEKLQAKVTGGIVVLVCLLSAPWDWLIRLLRAGNQ